MARPYPLEGLLSRLDKIDEGLRGLWCGCSVKDSSLLTATCRRSEL